MYDKFIKMLYGKKNEIVSINKAKEKVKINTGATYKNNRIKLTKNCY